MFKVNNKVPELRYCRRSGVIMVNLNIFHTFFSVSIFNFEQINAGWYKVPGICSILRILTGKGSCFTHFSTGMAS